VNRELTKLDFTIHLSHIKDIDLEKHHKRCQQQTVPWTEKRASHFDSQNLISCVTWSPRRDCVAMDFLSSLQDYGFCVECRKRYKLEV
jgi:hypothetical protein